MMKKKLYKRIAALGIVGAMTVAMAMPAMAATVDSSISVTGLTIGDKVTAYKIAEPDQTVKAGWKLCGTYGSLTIDDILDSVDTKEYGTIAATLSGGTEETLTTTTWTKSSPDAGIYLLKITPANAGIIYNPIVVSADYSSTNATNTVSAKKTDVTVTKSTTEAQRDVAAGDVITFNIASTVPCYPSNYSNPTYKISDTLTGPITFTAIQSVTLGESTTLSANTDYTVTSTTTGFTITLSEAGIKKVQDANTAQAIKVVYTGTVSSTVTDFANNVTRINNKAEVEYSNDPNSNSTAKVNDETNHYTFSLDANLAGSDSTTNKELVKVGVDQDGNDITNANVVTTTNYTALSGAVFSLSGGDSSKTYSATSDSNGYLKFTGLDKGTYTLKETSAPAGYMPDSTEYMVVINPTYAGDGKTLASYTVTIKSGDNVVGTSSYTITNSGTNTVSSTSTVGTSLFKNTQAKSLPSTGGMGTTVFYILGAVIVIGAGVVLVARRRANAQ